MFTDKRMRSEEDIKRLYITPAIESKWDRYKLRMEEGVQFTDGKVNIKGNVAKREKPKKADYLLYIAPNNPIAVVEAKDNTRPASFGLQQAMEYAKMLDVPFAYASNGDEFAEHDFLTGEERLFGLGEFPTEEELAARWKAELNGGEGITPEQERIIGQPYYYGQNTHQPRYYQRIAVNRTLDAIARGQNRILLVMATGCGKTYTAFQIIYRLLKSGTKRKILYLADRNILVDQSIQQDFRPLEKEVHKVNYQQDKKNLSGLTAYTLYFALYQQLYTEDVPDSGIYRERFKELFQPDFFDLIIVDECHRGSAAADSRWRQILEYFSSATQIGMTATPKETKYVSNIDYFGEPVYTYSLNQGIEDGFLAPFKVIKITTNIGDGWRPVKGQLDKNGDEIPDRIYTNDDYDYKIVIEDRTDQVAAEITRYLKATDRMAKTIVFCASEDAAERMRVALVNQNADMVKENPDYVVRITASDDYGKSKLGYFISKREAYPVIATTSELLSTGADCKMTKLIALDQKIGSMGRFKQIIGRGTRLLEEEGKTHFAVMDFRDISGLFLDPDWDGPVEIDVGFNPGAERPKRKPKQKSDPGDKTVKPIVDKNGCTVKVINKTVSVYDPDGKLIRTVDIIDYTKENVLGEYPSLSAFIEHWRKDPKRETIREMLLERGIDLEKMKAEQNMNDIDDFDFICHVAYDKKAFTRRERADRVKQRDFFKKYEGAAREVLEELLDKYMALGIYEIDKLEILKLDTFRRFGKPSKIASLFGGKDEYIKAVRDLEDAIYMDLVG